MKMFLSQITKINILIVIYTRFTKGNDVNVSEACFGVQLSCTLHNLQCSAPLIISIENAAYGFREGCLSAVSSCTANTTLCCAESPGDCFLPYNNTDLSDLQQLCFNTSSCQLDGSRSDLYCDNTRYSAYNKIEYKCITPETSTSSSSTESTTTASSSTESTTTASSSTESTTTASSSTESTTTASSSTESPTTSSTTTITESLSPSPSTILPTSSVESSPYFTDSVSSSTQSLSTTDPTPTSPVPASTTNIGAIIGSVVGSLIVVAVIVHLAVYIYKRVKRDGTISPGQDVNK